MQELPDRFWSKVDQSAGPNACWPWTAYRNPGGYGEVNPAHLFPATRAANHADMRAKGRSAPGERRWNARLTADAVRTIREEAAVGADRGALAKRFGISRRTVGKVITRSLWAHVQ